MGREFPAQPVVGVGAVVLRRRAGSPGLPSLTALPSFTALEVLLIRRANPPLQGEWSLPGGVVELGERLEEAVAREVLEETGLSVEVLGQVGVLDHIVRDRLEPAAPAGDVQFRPVRFHYVLIDFACRVAGGVLASATDALDACWRPADELSEQGDYALRPKTMAVIRKAIDAFSDVVLGT